MYARCPRCRSLTDLDRSTRCRECDASLADARRLPVDDIRYPRSERDVLFDTRMSRAVIFVVTTGVIAGLTPLVIGANAYGRVFGGVLFALVVVSVVAWLGSRYAPVRTDGRASGCGSALSAVGMVVLGVVSLVAGLIISLFFGCADDWHG